MIKQTNPPSRRSHWLTNKLNLVLAALAFASMAAVTTVRADDDNRERRRTPELPTPVCDSVNVPDGHRVTGHVYALGVQIYRWSGTNWVFIAPEATLFADSCYAREVGIHYAGPTWEANDGSKVVGARIAGCTPERGAIPWLLLGATSAPDRGMFSRLSHIQRVNTIGGTAPAEAGLFVGDEARVPYTTEYYFYRAIPRPPMQSDAVLDWNTCLEEVVFATAQPVPSQPRSAAMVHLAMFDAVNGVEHRYTPYHVTAAAPRGAGKEAAAVQAAYTVLRALYPTQTNLLDARLVESLAKVPGKRESITRGRAWGEYVANQILALRSTDHWNDPQPPFMGGFAVGQWRSLPFSTNADGALPAVFPQNAVLTPFAMNSTSEFRPGSPYGALIPNALLTAEYAADLDEVKTLGRVDSAVRTPQQTEIARLWQAMGAIDEIRAARALVSPRASLVDTARLFALASMTACDALIIGADSKFAYQLWRPHHAIRLADTDGNPSTIADPEWTGLILAPRFPEYVSNHSVLTASIMRVLAHELGDENSFSLGTPLLPGVTVNFERFSDAAAQVKEARIWGGIHFRHACDVGEELGVSLADFVVANYLTPICKK